MPCIPIRLFIGHLSSKQGKAHVALACVPIKALGRLLAWWAGAVGLAAMAAALTDFGCSLAFPALGVEAVRRAPSQAWAAAMALSHGVALRADGTIDQE